MVGPTSPGSAGLESVAEQVPLSIDIAGDRTLAQFLAPVDVAP